MAFHGAERGPRRLAQPKEMEFSSHAREMLGERNILEEWVWRTLLGPDKKEWHEQDGNMHYTRAIPEKGERVLHVVVNERLQLPRIVTVFFDRRLRSGKNETEN